MSEVEFLPHQAPPAEPLPPAPPLPPEFDDKRPVPSGRRRRGLGPRSLTARLVTGVVSLVIVLVLATGTSTYYALRSVLYHRLDQQLRSTSSLPSLQALLGARGNGFGRAFQVPTTVWVAVISDETGAITSYQPSGPDVTSLRLSPQTLKALDKHRYGPASRTTADHERVRMVAAPNLTLTTFDDATGLRSEQNVTVLIGLSEADITGTLGQLVDIELWIGGAAVLLALIATSYGVRLSMRGLRRVTKTANDVAAELSPTGAGLERRVDVPDDGSEVGQLAESMNTLLSAVETQFAARLEIEARLRQFLADASHELRTPLTSIRGYAELARMQRAAGADAEDNLSRIESEGTRMSRLVEDLLTLARGDQDASAVPARELVDVGELIDDAARDTRAAFPNRRVDAQPLPNLHLIGDHDQLLRAVRNLMANAAVHTAPERPILVRCAPDGDSVVIQVIDGGPGLPPEEAAHVFERFWRADKARTRVRGGSGLGLSIVSAIVATHGGTVRFDSSVETGSTVTVRLPAVSV